MSVRCNLAFYMPTGCYCCCSFFAFLPIQSSEWRNIACQICAHISLVARRPCQVDHIHTLWNVFERDKTQSNELREQKNILYMQPNIVRSLWLDQKAFHKAQFGVLASYTLLTCSWHIQSLSAAHKVVDFFCTSFLRSFVRVLFLCHYYLVCRVV